MISLQDIKALKRLEANASAGPWGSGGKDGNVVWQVHPTRKSKLLGCDDDPERLKVIALVHGEDADYDDGPGGMYTDLVFIGEMRNAAREVLMLAEEALRARQGKARSAPEVRDEGEGTVQVVSSDAEDILAARGLRVMARHKGDGLPKVLQTSVARLGRTIGIMLADLHTVRSPEGGDSAKHIEAAEQLFGQVLREGLAQETAAHRRRRAKAKLDEPAGWA